MIIIDGFRCFNQTADQIDEIGKLANEGHNDALVAFGRDCLTNGYVRGLRDSVIALGISTAAVTGYYAIKSYISRRRLQKAVKEFNEFVEAQTEEAK